MKQALISPNETTYSYDGTPLGQRIAQVNNLTFDVAPPLFWVECADDVVADQFYYADGIILPVPVPAPPPVAAPMTETIQGGPTIVE